MLISKYKKMKRPLAIAIAAAMMTGLAGCGPKNVTEMMAEPVATELLSEEDGGDLTEILKDSIKSSSADDSDKEETVYIFTDAEGRTTDIIVNEWLKNKDGVDEIKDVSTLTDIENIKGDESFTQDGKNLTWKTDGKDIYYQGHTDADSPVEVKVSYTLNGKTVSPSEIAGKTGDVTIRFEYINNLKSDEDIYTPFVMATGLILSGERFSDVTVDNGRVISDGDRFIVVGYGMPGLTESLDIDSDEELLPDSFEIHASAEKFEYDMAMTVAVTNLIGGEDADITDIEDKINSLADEYSDGMNTLVNGIKDYTDGVGRLADGINELSDGTGKLQDGGKTLADGIGTAKSGAGALSDGAKTLATGANALAAGVDSLAAGADSARQGAGTLSEGLDSAKNGADTVTAGAGALMSGAGSLSSGIKTYTDGVDSAAGGAAILVSGAGQLAEGTVQLQVGSQNLLDGVNAYTSGVESAKSGADSLAAGINNQVMPGLYNEDAENPGLVQGTASVAAGIGTLEEQVGAMFDTLRATQNAIEQNAGGKPSAENMAALQSGVRQAADIYAEAYGAVFAAAYSEAYKTAIAAGMSDTEASATAAGTAAAAAASNENVAAASAAVTEYSAKLAAYSQAYGADNVVTTILGNEGAFEEGIDTLKGGAEAVQNGTLRLYAGMQTVQNGVSELDAGLGQLDDKSADLVNGAEAVKNGVTGLKNGASQLNGGINQLNTGLGTLSDNSAALNQGAGELRQGSESLAAGSAALSDGLGQLSDGAAILYQGLGTLSQGAGEAKNGAGSLSAGAKELSGGTVQIYTGLEQLYAGATTLSTGINSLGEGVGKLKDGAGQLTAATPDLVDGSNKLNDATDEIVDKLHDAESDIEKLTERFNRMKRLGAEYQSFAGISDGMKGSVKFIIKSDGVSADNVD